MKRTLLIAVLLMLCGSLPVAHAGWWHHYNRHQHYYPAGASAPAYYLSAPMQYSPSYYAAPTYAAPYTSGNYSPNGSQAGLGEAIAMRLLESLLTNLPDIIKSRVGGGSNGGTTGRVDLDQVKADLAALRSDVGSLSGRVENINSTLQRHGEELVSLHDELRKLRGEIDETTEFRSTLVKIRDQLDAIKPADLKAKVLNEEFKGELRDAITDQATFDKAVETLQQHLDRVLK